MSINHEVISSDHLFTSRPEVSNVTISEFYHTIKTNVPKSIDQTYALIKSSTSTAFILNIWEIRLSLILFNNNLTQAKQEAINLNNALYLNENNNIPPSRATNNNIPLSIYPLPRNNNGEITHNLLVLLLRLKSVPNLSLINDFYKLCYQLRLKNSDNELIANDVTISKKLINLSFDIMVILIINKHYYTLINFLDSLINEVESHDKVTFDNLRLLMIIIKILVMDVNEVSSQTINETISVQYAEIFIKINDETKKSLVYVLRNIDSIYSLESNQTLDIQLDDLNLSHLINLVLQGKISGRILCCTLGLWHLTNIYKFKLIQHDTDLEFISDISQKEQPTLEDCFDAVTSQWCDNIQRVYGLE